MNINIFCSPQEAMLDNWQSLTSTQNIFCFKRNPNLVYWKQTTTLFTMLLPYMCQQQIHSSNATYMIHTPLLHGQVSDNYVSIQTSYQLRTIKSVTKNTRIHSFHIIGICPWTNMPATFHKYVTLHFYLSLHIDPALLTTSITTKKLQHLFTILLQNMCQQ